MAGVSLWLDVCYNRGLRSTIKPMGDASRSTSWHSVKFSPQRNKRRTLSERAVILVKSLVSPGGLINERWTGMWIYWSSHNLLNAQCQSTSMQNTDFEVSRYTRPRAVPWLHWRAVRPDGRIKSIHLPVRFWDYDGHRVEVDVLLGGGRGVSVDVHGWR